MRTPTTFLLGLSFVPAITALAADAPRGRLIELHSCEVFAGPCMVSSEVSLGGRYLVQAWDITGGSWRGVNLSGLKPIVLSTSKQSLAQADALADQCVIYLPEEATAVQRHALQDWLISRNAKLAKASVRTRVVPISMTRSAEGEKVQAGSQLSFRTVPMADCAKSGCGESLWYEPSATTSVFTVAVNGGAQISEPLLELKWADHGKRSVFVAQFGDEPSPRNLYVQSSDWCGLAGLSL